MVAARRLLILQALLLIGLVNAFPMWVRIPTGQEHMDQQMEDAQQESRKEKVSFMLHGRTADGPETAEFCSLASAGCHAAATPQASGGGEQQKGDFASMFERQAAPLDDFSRTGRWHVSRLQDKLKKLEQKLTRATSARRLLSADPPRFPSRLYQMVSGVRSVEHLGLEMLRNVEQHICKLYFKVCSHDSSAAPPSPGREDAKPSPPAQPTSSTLAGRIRRRLEAMKQAYRSLQEQRRVTPKEQAAVYARVSQERAPGTARYAYVSSSKFSSLMRNRLHRLISKAKGTRSSQLAGGKAEVEGHGKDLHAALPRDDFNDFPSGKWTSFSGDDETGNEGRSRKQAAPSDWPKGKWRSHSAEDVTSKSMQKKQMARKSQQLGISNVYYAEEPEDRAQWWDEQVRDYNPGGRGNPGLHEGQAYPPLEPQQEEDGTWSKDPLTGVGPKACIWMYAGPECGKGVMEGANLALAAATSSMPPVGSMQIKKIYSLHPSKIRGVLWDDDPANPLGETMYFVIPSLHDYPSIPQHTKADLRDYVYTGHTFLSMGGVINIYILNELFGWNLLPQYQPGPYLWNDRTCPGTPFEKVRRTVSEQGNTRMGMTGVAIGSIPPGGKSYFDNDGSSVAMCVPIGRGRACYVNQEFIRPMTPYGCGVWVQIVRAALNGGECKCICKGPLHAREDSDGKSLINSYCAKWRDEKTFSATDKQVKYMIQCMQQDCVQSLEGGDPNSPTLFGCRFLDVDGFCYAYGSAQMWCRDNPTSSYCSDGGENFAIPPLGSASVAHWLPKKNIPIYDGEAISGAAPYGCACMPNCSCTKKSCRCVNAQQISVGSSEEAAKFPSKVIQDDMKAGECDCKCAGQDA
ncbi:hypothetical protein GUITHDRAFT_163823 [Guillardia theta CCMP2712]|uniref:Apple domain-containing protein n=1 Tax=Guillardia theta (strain CCMP2712) TaxID=905079 RepID=L1J5R1_GUITC|nr:hypothetical protein GUITHDRAFT_163823 [Guillardia theta CCMP2712]EKX43677.1 hypothetical protein GUITHDRAFT_163823 [Guillardia theta CCMP2712]|eukprot:XP_005830657.1 hypothetical protein GUITHDRAFT_163823 [Guillardia theta CCMP2712]